MLLNKSKNSADFRKNKKSKKKFVKSCDRGDYPSALLAFGGGVGVVIISNNNRQCTKSVGFIHKKKADKTYKPPYCLHLQLTTICNACNYTQNIDPYCVYIYC